MPGHYRTPMGSPEDPHAWHEDYKAIKGRKRRHHRRRGPWSPGYTKAPRARHKARQKLPKLLADNTRYLCAVGGCSIRVIGMRKHCHQHYYAYSTRGHPLLGAARMRKTRKYVRRYVERYNADPTFRILEYWCHLFLFEHQQAPPRRWDAKRGRACVMPEAEKCPEHGVARRLVEHHVSAKDVVLALVSEWYWLRVNWEALAERLSVTELYKVADIRLGTAIMRLCP